MKVSEVLTKFPGLARSTLAFWEREGHIAPSKVLVRSLYGRREYSDEDIEKIKQLRGVHDRTTHDSITHYEDLAERVRRLESLLPTATSGDRFIDYLNIATQEKYM